MASTSLRSIGLPALIVSACLLLLPGCSSKGEPASLPTQPVTPPAVGGVTSGGAAHSIQQGQEPEPPVTADEEGGTPAGSQNPVVAVTGIKENDPDRSGETGGTVALTSTDPQVPTEPTTPTVPTTPEAPNLPPASPPATDSTGSSPATGGPTTIKFSEMYAGSSSRGLKFSDKFAGLSGKQVTITGYMAPPLKPSFEFFVLTREPMAICPFCSTDASWPEDIILIYLPEGKDRTPTDSVLTVTGTLDLGSYTDPDTGFVSQARIHSTEIKVVR